MAALESQLVESQDFTDLLDYNLAGDNSTLERKRAFLNAYREEGVIYRAALAARIHRTTVYKWLENDPAFVDAFGDCHEDTYDNLESSGFKKALAGDTLLTMFYLKAHRPKFRDKLQVDIESVDNEIKERMRSVGPRLQLPIDAMTQELDGILPPPSESASEQKE